MYRTAEVCEGSWFTGATTTEIPYGAHVCVYVLDLNFDLDSCSVNPNLALAANVGNILTLSFCAQTARLLAYDPAVAADPTVLAAVRWCDTAGDKK